MASIRAVVADDDPFWRERVAGVLQRTPGIEVVGLAADGAEAVSLARAALPRLLMLDVELPVLDGFGVMASVTAGTSPAPATIFVAGHCRHAVRAFDVRAVDFVLKPWTDARLESAVRRACDALQAAAVPAAPARRPYLERLAIRHDGRVTLIDLTEIDWIEACGVYVTVHARGQAWVHRASLSQLAERLPPSRFVRVHRSTLVNATRVRELRSRGHGDYTLVLKCGAEVVLSRSQRPLFEQWLQQPL